MMIERNALIFNKQERVKFSENTIGTIYHAHELLIYLYKLINDLFSSKTEAI